MKKIKHNLWYTRRGKAIRGPFPQALISRYILLGRIIDSDELSQDQIHWEYVESLPALKPDVLKADLNLAENKEKLRIALLREDERQPLDRRDDIEEQLSAAQQSYQLRSGKERRDAENMVTIKHRQVKYDFFNKLQQSNENYKIRILLVICFVIAIIGFSVKISPTAKVSINYCNQLPIPYVNWSNCSMEGSKLTGTDLTGAKLLNTKMSGSLLDNVKLAGAKLSYAEISNSNFRHSDLHEAVLMGANLRNSILIDANMNQANLSYAILHGADLTNASLKNANLAHAVLTGAKLSGADLSGAILDKTIWIDNSVCAPQSKGECLPINKP